MRPHTNLSVKDSAFVAVLNDVWRAGCTQVKSATVSRYVVNAVWIWLTVGHPLISTVTGQRTLNGGEQEKGVHLFRDFNSDVDSEKIEHFYKVTSATTYLCQLY